MSLQACGITVAINGSLTDVDVENDSASWTTKIGNVRITQGGGSFLRRANPAVCQFDLLVPPRLATRVRTVTIGVTVIGAAGNGTTLTPDDYDPIVGTGAGAYRIVFHGDVQSIRIYEISRDDDNDLRPIQFDATSDMSALLNRRARVAADTDSGIRTLLDDIETAHGLTMAGNDRFNTVAQGFPNSDRPKQKRLTNGEIISTMLAPTGCNMVEDWAGTITAPELRWRPDFQGLSAYWSSGPATTAMYGWEIGYPWLLRYDDVGWGYEDFVARITVNGEDSAGNQYYGWARLNDSYGVRGDLGNREAAVTSYIDTAADCKTWSRRLLAYQGAPPWSPRMNAVTLNTEVYYSQGLSQGYRFGYGSGGDAEMEILFLAGLFPGDELWPRGYVDTSVSGADDFGNGNSHYGDWPAWAPDGGDLYENLLNLWYSYIGTVDVDAGNVYYPTTHHTIRQVTRTFTPDGGWDITYGLVPYTNDVTGSDVGASDTDSGTD